MERINSTTNQTTSGINYKSLIETIKLVEIFVEDRIYSFDEMAHLLHNLSGKMTSSLLKGLKAAYLAYSSSVNDEIFSKFDSAEVVRNFSLKDLELEQPIVFLETKKTQDSTASPQQFNNSMLNHYKEIIKKYLKENKKSFYKSLTADELDGIVDYRAKNYLKQMENSENPQMEKEVYFQDMLTF